MWVLCLITYTRRIDVCYVFLFKLSVVVSLVCFSGSSVIHTYNLRRVSIALYGALHGFVYVCRGAKWGRFVNECAREVRSGTGSGSTMCWCVCARARALLLRALSLVTFNLCAGINFAFLPSLREYVLSLILHMWYLSFYIFDVHSIEKSNIFLIKFLMDIC